MDEPKTSSGANKGTAKPGWHKAVPIVVMILVVIGLATLATLASTGAI